jgi:hypothetical protein
VERFVAMTVRPVLCPVCQAHPLDPPKACEFCPESVVRALDEIERAIARLTAAGREIALVAAPVPT